MGETVETVLTERDLISVPPVTRAIRVLQHIAAGNNCANIIQTSKALNINRTTLHRLLFTLEQERLIEVASDAGGYILGTELINLAARSLFSRDIVQVAQPILKRLAADLGLAAHLGVVDGQGFFLRDPQNRRLRIVADVAVNADASTTFARPTKVSHVVLNTTDLKTSEAFFRDQLGFRLSDYYVERMSFMRCSHDHHSIGLMQNLHASANHVAFEMPDMDSYMRGIGRMKQQGHVPSWGPGRHGPGNNPFAYFVSPSGFVIEYTCELEQIDEANHVAKEWPWGDAEAGDRWMTAGPATPAMRTIMLGCPDPGFPKTGAA